MPENPTIELRAFETSNAPDLFSLIDTNRPQLAKFWWESQTNSVEDSALFIEKARVDESYTGRVTRGVWCGETLVGVGSVHSVDWELGRAALGCWIDRQHHSQGYATETVRQLSQLAFERMNLSVVTIGCREDNAGTRHVAEKAGFLLDVIDDSPTWNTVDGTTPRTVHYRLERPIKLIKASRQ